MTPTGRPRQGTGPRALVAHAFCGEQHWAMHAARKENADVAALYAIAMDKVAKARRTCLTIMGESEFGHVAKNNFSGVFAKALFLAITGEQVQAVALAIYLGAYHTALMLIHADSPTGYLVQAEKSLEWAGRRSGTDVCYLVGPDPDAVFVPAFASHGTPQGVRHVA